MTTEEISTVINSQMARFNAQPITPFDGMSYPASEWLIDFNSYMAVTGRKSDEEQKHSLTRLLTGDAKAWLRLQPKETRASYKLIRKNLQNRFSLSKDELFNRKRALYGICQASRQRFAQYLQVLQETALDTGVDQAELVKIAIAGAQQALKPHLAGSTAATIEELRAIPAVQPGTEPSHAIDTPPPPTPPPPPPTHPHPPPIIAAVIAQLNISNTAAVVSAPTTPIQARGHRGRSRTHDRDRSRESSLSRERSNHGLLPHPGTDPQAAAATNGMGTSDDNHHIGHAVSAQLDAEVVKTVKLTVKSAADAKSCTILRECAEHTLTKNRILHLSPS